VVQKAVTHPPATVQRVQPSVTHLLMLRHGQSEWNAAGRWQGHANPSLSNEGRQQASDAADRLGGFDAIWASDLERAAHTAAIIAAALGIGPVIVDERLRETDVGEWEGLTTAEVEAGWPGYLASHRRPDSFEDYDLAAARVAAALTDIAAAHPAGEVLIVSHGGVIRSLRRMLGAPDGYLGNLCGSWFQATADGAMHAGDMVNLRSDQSVSTARAR
jgi:broad specificity phosphatase PhoE